MNGWVVYWILRIGLQNFNGGEYKVEGEFGIDWYWFCSILQMENVKFYAVIMSIYEPLY